MSPSQKAARQAREKLAAKREAERRKQRRIQVITVVGVAVVVIAVAIGGAIFLTDRLGSDDKGSTQADGVRTFGGLSQGHVSGSVKYPQTPPVGGDHNEAWLNCGIYPTPVPNENAVHSLEHGAVWVTYQQGLQADQVKKLEGLVRGRPYTLLSPVPNLPSPVTASAWGKQLTVPNPDDPRLGKFIRDNAQSPKAPEPGAPCTNGVGNPAS